MLLALLALLGELRYFAVAVGAGSASSGGSEPVRLEGAPRPPACNLPCPLETFGPPRWESGWGSVCELLFVLIVSCMLKPSHTLLGSPKVHFYEKLTFLAAM